MRLKTKRHRVVGQARVGLEHQQCGVSTSAGDRARFPFITVVPNARTNNEHPILDPHQMNTAVSSGGPADLSSQQHFLFDDI